jgi:KaiC/GvpD/RAD55 family RecA-like ATPase
MKRVTSGIKGLDEMLGGGFPKGRVILITGGPGTGKTNMSLQFIASAADEGAPGVYVTRARRRRSSSSSPRGSTRSGPPSTRY